MDYKLIFGVLAIIFALISFVPYLYNILKNKTKPHVFSWFIWSLLTGITFFAQMSKEGGFGSWMTLTASLICFSIFLVSAFKYKIDYLKKIDWACFSGALLGIIFWGITNNPLTAVIITTITDAVGFVPTYRKAYYKPHEETASLYGLGSIAFLFSLIALQSFNLTTALYPASLVLTNGVFALFLIIRRSKIQFK